MRILEYKFAPNDNYEDLSCGRVIYHRAGFSNFPVRLASEIFMRCFELIGEPNKKVKTKMKTNAACIQNENVLRT